jgi:hypothetical protein
MDQEVAVTLPLCVHHWLIDSPTGEVSKAVCKLCGARREFDSATAQRTGPVRKVNVVRIS